jgi:hypothetical protein
MEAYDSHSGSGNVPDLHRIGLSPESQEGICDISDG